MAHPKILVTRALPSAVESRIAHDYEADLNPADTRYDRAELLRRADGKDALLVTVPDRLDAEIDLNIAALTRLSHAALAAMVPRGRGWLLNVSSIAGFQPAPRLAVYAATKAYVTSLTESLHEEVRGSGVHVTALCPGLTKTEFQSVSNTETYADQFPDLVWTSPEQVARTGLDAVVANRAIAVPGVQYQVMSAVTNMTPRWLRRRVSSLVQRA